jgi:hypothetical protein
VDLESHDNHPPLNADCKQSPTLTSYTPGGAVIIDRDQSIADPPRNLPALRAGHKPTSEHSVQDDPVLPGRSRRGTLGRHLHIAMLVHHPLPHAVHLLAHAPHLPAHLHLLLRVGVTALHLLAHALHLLAHVHHIPAHARTRLHRRCLRSGGRCGGLRCLGSGGRSGGLLLSPSRWNHADGTDEGAASGGDPSFHDDFHIEPPALI